MAAENVAAIKGLLQTLQGIFVCSAEGLLPLDWRRGSCRINGNGKSANRRAASGIARDAGDRGPANRKARARWGIAGDRGRRIAGIDCRDGEVERHRALTSWSNEREVGWT